MKALGLVVSEIFVFCFSHCKYIFYIFYPRDMVRRIFDLRGMVGRIYKEDTLLHTEYESSGSCGFGEDFFMFFP